MLDRDGGMTDAEVLRFSQPTSRLCTEMIRYSADLVTCSDQFTTTPFIMSRALASASAPCFELARSSLRALFANCHVNKIDGDLQG